MRYIDIFIFSFIFNIALSLMYNGFGCMGLTNGQGCTGGAFNITGTGYEVGGQSPKDFAEKYSEQLNASGTEATRTGGGTTNVLGGFLNLVYYLVFVMAPTMVTVLSNATILFPVMISNILGTMFGVNVDFIRLPLYAIMVLMSFFAVYQIWTGRSLREGQ